MDKKKRSGRMARTKIKTPKKFFSNKRRTAKARGIAEGYRSGLEEKVAKQLQGAGIEYKYEEVKINYTIPASSHYYLADFVLPNGIIVETKGRFLPADRKKHLYVRNCNPDLDIRFVFSNSNAKLSKYSKTTYADWCERYKFKYTDKEIPQEWLNE